MKPIEIRLDLNSVKPLLDHIGPILDSLSDELVVPGNLPGDDDLLENFWEEGLLESQRGEMDTIKALFGESFRETGRAVMDIDQVDTVIKACSAVRLKLRETSLKDIPDSDLEQGQIELEDLDSDQRIGYGAYMLFASLQELAITQMEHGDLDDQDGAN